MRRDNEYQNAGCEAYIGEELKTYGARRMRAAYDFWVCIIGIVLTSMVLGFIAGSLYR